jgi:L-seryl-tRNA(Ser) seleniumtransferase
MANASWGNVYKKLGARPLINAQGNQTVRGGSTPSAAVRKAMQEADTSYVEMEELLEKTGQFIAGRLGVEDAYVTAGCYTALVLTSATVMTGNDPDKMAQLPDTSGLKDEIVFQKMQHYTYDRAFTIPGSKLIYVGDENGCTAEALNDAIGENTAAVAYLIQAEHEKAVSLADAIEIAHSHNLPLIADAAAQIYPLDYFQRNAQSADLVCFGGKYFNAPHSTGFICGRKDLIEVVRQHGFIGPRPVGRGMKVDRQEIIGLVTAIDIWLSTDHDKRLKEQDARYAALEHELESVNGVSCEVHYGEKSHTLSNLHVNIDAAITGKDAAEIVQALDAGTPRIKVNAQGKEALVINAYTLNAGEEYIIANALRHILGS